MTTQSLSYRTHTPNTLSWVFHSLLLTFTLLSPFSLSLFPVSFSPFSSVFFFLQSSYLSFAVVPSVAASDGRVRVWSLNAASLNLWEETHQSASRTPQRR